MRLVKSSILLLLPFDYLTSKRVCFRNLWPSARALDTRSGSKRPYSSRTVMAISLGLEKEVMYKKFIETEREIARKENNIIGSLSILRNE